MKIRTWLIGSLLAGLAVTAGAEQSPPATQSAQPDAQQTWQQHWEQMQEYRKAWQAAKTPEERQRLQEQHWNSMQQGMAGACPMMGAGKPGGGMGMHGGGCGGMGMHGGMQGGKGGMMGQPTKEQLDQHIEHMEKMLEQMRAHRQMLDKQ